MERKGVGIPDFKTGNDRLSGEGGFPKESSFSGVGSGNEARG